MDKSVKAFFITTAALEAGAGVAMVLFPLQAVSLLLGPDAAGPGAIPIEKVAGCALVALASRNSACGYEHLVWLVLDEEKNGLKF